MAFIAKNINVFLEENSGATTIPTVDPVVIATSEHLVQNFPPLKKLTGKKQSIVGNLSV